MSDDDEDNNDEDRRPLVNLRVILRQKARWDRYAKESNMYSSLSDLIRKSVEKEIAQDTEESATDGELVGELQTELNSLSEDIEQLQRDVSWLRSREEHDVEEFAHTLFSNLESVPTDDPETFSAKIGFTAGIEPQTTKALADRLDTTPRRVEEAIDFLREQHMPLIKLEIDGETHWFKEE